MSHRPFLIGIALCAAGCVAQDPAQTTFPQQWGNQPQVVYGPPGGQMDPSYGYQPTGYPAGYPDGYAAPSTEDQAAADTSDQAAMPEPSSDPQDPGYDMGAVTDPEIDATLDGYGTWEDNEDYGRVWRPNTTVVGVDFTPYETCGTWVWSDWGWNYSCDWSWGWLPFHYGRWGWFDGYWGWVPGYEWGPAWVEWRNGGGYVGWRPLGPNVRDHRGEHDPPGFHDHRYATAHDSHWRFASETDFGHSHIRGHLFQNPAEGLRVTQPVTRPNLRGNYTPVASASLMRARLASRWSNAHATPQRPAQSWHAQQPGYRANETPTWRPQHQTWQQPQQGFRQPPQTWQQPQQPWRQPQQQWRQPQQQWRQPQQTWRQPSQPTWHAPAPSRPTWSPPSHSSSWSAPSHSSSWSAPSHSSSSGGGFHSSGGGGGGGHSSGGGGGGGHSGGGGHGGHR